MADKSSRWDQLKEKSTDKPAFLARQSTESYRRPDRPDPDQPHEHQPHHHQRRSRRYSKGRSGRTWYMVGVIVLVLLAAVLAWQLLAT